MAKEILDNDVIQIIEGDEVFEGVFEKPDLTGKDFSKLAFTVSKIKPDVIARREFAALFSTTEESLNVQGIDEKIPEFISILNSVFKSKDGSDRIMLSTKETYLFLASTKHLFAGLFEEESAGV